MSHKPPRTEKSIDCSNPTNYCPQCEQEFPASEARSVHVREPGAIIWECPCGHTSRGIAPDEARPPVIEALNVTATDGLTTCEIVFPNGAKLQHRETDDGHVREEVISSTGVELESVSIGRRETDVFTAFTAAIKHYSHLTTLGVRREMPRVAAAILDEHER